MTSLPFYDQDYKGLAKFILKLSIGYLILHFTLLMEMTARAVIGTLALFYFRSEIYTIGIGQFTLTGFAVLVFIWVLLPLWWQFGVNGFNKWIRKELIE